VNSIVIAGNVFSTGSLSFVECRPAVHHKELSLIVEETESKLLLEIESDEGVSKRSLASSLTSSSDSTGRVSSSGARSLSPPHDLMLTESTDDGDDDGVMGDKGGGDYDDDDGGTFLRQISLRGSGAGGSSAAILELAWRVVVSIIFLGWLRKEAPPQNPTTRVRGRAKFNEDSSAGSSLPP
jgi:hypothetical protein